MPFVVLTGASAGIGRAAAILLAARGAEVAMVGRDPTKLRAAAAEARAVATQPVHEYTADFADLTQVRALGATLLERHRRIDVLANNAGAMFARRQVTVDGFEQTFAVNHLAGFLLTLILLDRLRESAGRVVATASVAHYSGRLDFDDLQRERGYGQHAAYAGSKLCNVLFTRELARRCPEIVATCFHPGLVRTDLTRDANLLWRVGAAIGAQLIRTPERAARDLVWLLELTTEPHHSGSYFVDQRATMPSASARNEAIAGKLWSISERLIRSEMAIP